MKIIILYFLVAINIMFAAQVRELNWTKGETFLSFLDKYSVPQKLYFNLEKEDKELCSEINADQIYYLYTNDDGSLNQVLIPVSEDIQIHLYKNSKGKFKFQTLPINYTEYKQTVAIQINNSLSADILKQTGDVALAVMLKSMFRGVDFRKMRRGDYVIIKYSQKALLGRAFGLPEIDAAMIEIGHKKYYRFKNIKNNRYYDQNGGGFAKEYFFKIPLRYKRISSGFTRKRWHPVLKRYRAHLGTDFAAPRGRKIYAAGPGKIVFAGRKGGYGKTIIINHGNGYKTLYAHQSKFAKGIKRGKRVKKGQHIGYVGSTGLSSGPHLHLGLYRNGKAVNPLSVIKKPKVNKYKKTFVANAKRMTKKFNKILKSKNKPKPVYLGRTTYKTDITMQ